jgi:glycosyltransferase involved in cell wall biosynthesis
MPQLLRECAPGYGGVERVAHALADECGGVVIALRRHNLHRQEAFELTYLRCWLPSFPVGRLLLPLPSRRLWALLSSDQPLVVHLPCPAVLVLAILAHVCRPQRQIVVYWHAFLQRRFSGVGMLEALYQHLALRLVRGFPVITTSPVLEVSLQRCGLAPSQVYCLPCALPDTSERALTALWHLRHGSLASAEPTGTVIAIGRHDSYKRFDWLLDALVEAPAVRELHLVGDGPDRLRLEALARALPPGSASVHFHGRVSEARKHELLSLSDVLVLPADRCNEAFGIVQLEAMACGIPALAFQLPRSGMHWVSALPALPWHGRPSELPAILQRLMCEADLYRQACLQARQRYEQEFCREVWCRRLAALSLIGTQP